MRSDAAATGSLRDDLLRLVGDEARVSTSESVLDEHAGDLSAHEPRRPDAVVYPVSTAEVAAVLRHANAASVPVVPFGLGTSLEGHVIPVRGGITLDLTRMDRILELSPENLLAVVQPGVPRSRLEREAGGHGLFFPIDPGADATLGGMAATNASGTTSVRYGSMRAQVLALEVVLADGTVLRPGRRVAKSSAGYDLASLFVGSEGTLGVVTELTLRLHGIPEAVVAARAVFPDVEGACRTASALVAAGSQAARIELLDAWTVEAVNAYAGTSYPAAPTLFLEFAGLPAAVEAEVADAKDLARENGCSSFEFESDAAARARLWSARHDAAFAVMATAPGKKARATDVCVPVAELPAAIRRAREAIEELGLTAGITGHAGDGNYHVAVMIDPADPGDAARAAELADVLVADALARGGTCTGEHGVGLGKIAHLVEEHGDLIPAMRALKRLFDPNGILNPGKILPPEA